jgi:hypothetical protein
LQVHMASQFASGAAPVHFSGAPVPDLNRTPRTGDSCPGAAQKTHQKLLDVAVEMGLSQGTLLHEMPPPPSESPLQTETIKTGNEAPKTGKRSPPADESRDPPHLHGPKATEAARSEAAVNGRQRNPNGRNLNFSI